VSVFRQNRLTFVGQGDGMTTTTQTLTVHAADPARLETVRSAGVDEHGNPLTPYPASGSGEPLRCCLRFARAGEPIALISWAPSTTVSPWREVGPVYVHAESCAGYDRDGLPPELDRGPRVLRTYRADGSMNYTHNTLADDEELAPLVDRLLAEPDVATVHVRTVLPQCFLYAVTR
jgi:Protein of unknown function (DUF1203)